MVHVAYKIPNFGILSRAQLLLGTMQVAELTAFCHMVFWPSKCQSYSRNLLTVSPPPAFAVIE
jgi:hypothetical protein